MNKIDYKSVIGLNLLFLLFCLVRMIGGGGVGVDCCFVVVDGIVNFTRSCQT